MAEDCQDDNSSDSSSENVDHTQDSMFVSGNVCEGVKKQASGMRRLLDSRANSVRIHQPLMQGRGGAKREPEPRDVTWLHRGAQRDEPYSSQALVWKDVHVQTHDPFASGGYGGEGSRSSKPIVDPNTDRIQGILESNGEMTYSALETNCCMCDCQPTLQAILQELRTLRELMQAQAGPQSTVQVPTAHTNPLRSNLLRNKIIKKRLIHRLRPLPAQPSRKLLQHQMVSESQAERNRTSASERLSTDASAGPAPARVAGSCIPDLESVHNSDLLEPEVRLAEGYDVLIPKSQLESILLNYSRTGSLLFRKLVSAFFDDRTLANSLPNGKRKRGANDNRKGLDQNIVGAIKVFTEKYCTLNRIDRVPGPKDWIQILQDQIKLARKRLKRGAVLETFDSGGKMGTSLILNSGGNVNAGSSSDIWSTSEPVCTVQI